MAEAVIKEDYIQLEGMVRIAQRAPINPYDLSTVVSIYPREIVVENPTTQPQRYVIPAGSYDSPSVIIVGSASWWRVIVDMPPIEVPIPSNRVAEGIINDYCNGLPNFGIGLADPGIFWLPREVELSAVKTLHKDKLDAALIRQKTWFKALVDRADIDFARSNGNPRAVNEIQRLAAEVLNLKGKPWMENVQAVALVNCPACGFLKDPKFPICANCKTNIPEFEKSQMKK